MEPRIKILLAEDKPSIRQEWCAALRAIGFEGPDPTPFEHDLMFNEELNAEMHFADHVPILMKLVKKKQFDLCFMDHFLQVDPETGQLFTSEPVVRELLKQRQRPHIVLTSTNHNKQINDINDILIATGYPSDIWELIEEHLITQSTKRYVNNEKLILGYLK